jgi:hypothetical protein
MNAAMSQNAITATYGSHLRLIPNIQEKKNERRDGWSRRSSQTRSATGL